MYSLAHAHCSRPTEVEVSCYGYEGIDAVKEALAAGLQKSTEEMPIRVSYLPAIILAHVRTYSTYSICSPPPPPQINLIAPPHYVMTTTTLDKPEGIAALNASIQIIKDSIEEQDGGHFNVKVEVRTYACKLLLLMLWH